jgi:hypothetical protein
MFNQEISNALQEFVEQGNKKLLLERIEFYNSIEITIKKLNEKYLIRILDSELDSVQFEISLNSFL